MPKNTNQQSRSVNSSDSKNKESEDKKQQLNFSIDYELDKEFRSAVYRKKGLRRGAMVEAFQEALKMWVDELENDRK